MVVLSRVATTAIGHEAPQEVDAKVVELQKVKDNLYLLKGGGANSVAFVTDLGVVLIDTKPAGWGPSIAQKLKTVTNKPVTTIINTHAHVDHVSGNEFFPASVEIIAHENTRAIMDKMPMFGGAKATFLPKLTFKEKTTIGAGKDRIDLYFFGAGHTGGDAWVVFPAVGVAYCGDLLVDRALPVIDIKSGGSGMAYSDTLAKATTRIGNAEIIITGHDGLMAMKDLEEYTRFTRYFRDMVITDVHRGLSIGEVAEAWKAPEQYRSYAAPPDRVRANVEAIFGELTR